MDSTAYFVTEDPLQKDPTPAILDRDEGGLGALCGQVAPSGKSSAHIIGTIASGGFEYWGEGLEWGG